MIRTAADLFCALRDRELSRLRSVDDVRHSGMIGDMYEGLSRTLLRRVIPGGLDVRVVQGKVRNSDGTLSAQMDLMVVVGEGQQLPYTEHFVYPEQQVIAVIEIKKTLTGAALGSAIDVLKSVGAPDRDDSIPMNRIRSALHCVLGIELPRSGDDTDRLSPYQQMTFFSHPCGCDATDKDHPGI